MVKKFKNPKRSQKIFKITFFTFSFCVEKKIEKKKKNYPLSYPILGAEGRKKSLCLKDFRCGSHR